MFLKQLDILGFKSFAEKTSIDFVKGVTAVVGPNGSGKSNVTDAIRWVLGEQSAKSLRGGKMEDVIFSGSDSRKPLNYADVSLLLDNSDGALPVEYNEVSVTRRVFRSGDSEYLLNSQHCRLKDIVDLFMDSGLGKEAFSIISQGKVEEILNSRPEDRRTIFEEAAGVLKYKTRKKKAEGKLSETTENLQRVNDILSELEGQIEPLQIQASIARDYLEKKEELENYEVALTVYEIDQLSEQWNEAKVYFGKINSDHERQSSELHEKEQSIQVKRKQLSKHESELEQLQQHLLQLTQQLEKLTGRKDVLNERKKNANHNTKQLEQNIEDTTMKYEQLVEKKAQIEAEKAAKEKEASHLKQERSERKQRIILLDGKIEETIESLKSDYIELLNEQAQAKNEIQYLEQQFNQQTMKNERLDIENEKFLKERNDVITQLKNAEQELQELNHTLETKRNEYKSKEDAYQLLKSKVNEQQELTSKAKQFLQNAKSRKETLEGMEEDYVGFFQGVREILKAREKGFNGIEGAVAEMIQVPKKFELAIETALGSTMQHVIVKTDQDGRKAIDYLKKNNFGRATFLPLNMMREKNIQSTYQQLLINHESFVGIATDVIQYKEAYAPALKNLLGTTIIAHDLKGATELAKLVQQRFRIVTLDGDIINPGGAMTGGQVQKKTNSLIGRKTELEELQTKIISMQEKTATLVKEYEESLDQLKESEQTLERLKIEGEDVRQQYNELEAEIFKISMSKKNLDDRLAIYDLEKSEMSNEKETLHSRMDYLKQQLKTNEAKTKALNAEIEKLTEQRDSERLSKEALTEELNHLNAEHAVVLEQLSGRTNALNELTIELKNVYEQKTTYEDQLHWLKNEMTDHSTSENQLNQQSKETQAEKQQVETSIDQMRVQRKELMAALENAEYELKSMNDAYQSIHKKMHDEEIRMNRLEVELDTRLEKLREGYEISYEGAKANYPLKVAPEEAAKQVKLIKLGIEELGSVNIGAIDEFERVHERYSFLLSQKLDLSEAKETLFQIITEMDQEMEKRFSQSFSAIKSQFDGVFKALFGGGQAELKLTEPKDLLTTGVDIIAQPPGKKLQNLSLLSGGERALTAIALLFSILKVRPVPFCVLDEVEAALDEANVHRFSNYLREFSKETQFIVITHRQGTMQGADVLYGVTMQESGVSKLVSVKLENEMVEIP